MFRATTPLVVVKWQTVANGPHRGGGVGGRGGKGGGGAGTVAPQGVHVPSKGGASGRTPPRGRDPEVPARAARLRGKRRLGTGWGAPLRAWGGELNGACGEGGGINSLWRVGGCRRTNHSWKAQEKDPKNEQWHVNLGCTSMVSCLGGSIDTWVRAGTTPALWPAPTPPPGAPPLLPTTPTPLPRAHGLERGGRGTLLEATGVGAKASAGRRGESAAKGCVRKRTRGATGRPQTPSAGALFGKWLMGGESPRAWHSYL